MSQIAAEFLAPDFLASIFEPLKTANGIVLAVSGGPDSVALMIMAAQWHSIQPQHRLYAATVDHGLRLGSRDEAEKVAEWAAKLNLPHAILSWEGEKPSRRLQEEARNARYALLADFAHACGAQAVTTAHHADDQAETVLLRLLSGSGVAGLSGMKALASLPGQKIRYPDILLARPFLNRSKAELVALCDGVGHPYFTDPSNENLLFARVRLRQKAVFFSQEGLDKSSLLRLSRRAARADEALEEMRQVLEKKCLLKAGPDFFTAQADELVNVQPEVLLRLLQHEILRINVNNTHLRLDRLETVTAELCKALKNNSLFSRTCGGILIRLDGKGKMLIKVEKPRRIKKSE